MTLKERARKLSETFLVPETVFETALREELLELASEFEAEAAHKIDMYAGLGLSGEDQVRPFLELAQRVRQRMEA